MVRVKVYESCDGNYWSFGIFEGKAYLMRNVQSNYGSMWWRTKKVAIRKAKAMAKRIGIKYSDEIIKQHGC